jgi:hypothetical protein
VKAEFYPGAASAIHIHPLQEEYYKVHQGEIELYLDREWKILKAGEEVFIPKGTIHGFRNKSSQVASLTNIHIPGLHFGQSLKEMETLTRKGKIDGIKGFRNLVHLSQYSLKYIDTTTPVKPSMFLLRFLAQLGKLFRYRI